ncbi:MAG: long-chain-acyl-CoA synthetase [Alphaproteobacteria bacterium]|nr:long-chain-acyl-CoA synthetase [Alphaproteobacteria bacterium]
MTSTNETFPVDAYDSHVAEILTRHGEIESTRPATVPQMLARNAALMPNKVAVLFEGRSWTYAELNGLANRYARWAMAKGYRKGDTLALFMENRPEFYAATYGLGRAGIAIAMINSALTGHGFAHCLAVAEAKGVIVDAALAGLFQDARPHLPVDMPAWATGGAVVGASDLDSELEACSPAYIPVAELPVCTALDTFVHIYTSGTTGLPKAVPQTHARVFGGAVMWAAMGQATHEDRMYLVMPLYHGAAFNCASGSMFIVGGSIALRRKFSARAFWADCVETRSTMFEYIGELCRYLVNTPEDPMEKRHSIRCCIGNGLRADVWPAFKARFRIPRVVEFYGATEGNVFLWNFDGTEGAIGRLRPHYKAMSNARVVRFDIEREEPIRNAAGRCIEVETGEVGEAIGAISDANRFDGYTSAEATRKKILRDVFTPGDAWYRTGDLMRLDAEGYVYFVDRIGDTFRWKGENVATGEVAEVMTAVPGVKEANVYGVAVPGADGRCGMACLTADETLDLAALFAHLTEELPAYARPLFLRLRSEQELTGTFKHRKVNLVTDGFDPSKVKDPLYFAHPEKGCYVKLDEALFRDIVAGRHKL